MNYSEAIEAVHGGRQVMAGIWRPEQRAWMDGNGTYILTQHVKTHMGVEVRLDEWRPSAAEVHSNTYQLCSFNEEWHPPKPPEPKPEQKPKLAAWRLLPAWLNRRNNMTVIRHGVYVVRTQAGFKKALKHFDEYDNIHNARGYPKQYPALVIMAKEYGGYDYTSCTCLPLSELKDILVSQGVK